MRLVTVKIPEIYLEGIDELVKLGRYSSRSEVIRTAIRDLLRRELWLAKTEREVKPPIEFPNFIRRYTIKRIRIS
ncbi:MAG TPA: ribbon-helix-helix protein, CopG family [Acidilobales archaeon]|nr:ribbon-helix-helix protein, CopG family [Acidilobales archaeon]